MKPDFDDEENFVLAYYRDKNASSVSRLNFIAGARDLVAIGFFSYGIFGDDLLWTIVAFGVLLVGNVRRMLETARYVRVFRSIFSKYEEALNATLSGTRTRDEGGAEQALAAPESKPEGGDKQTF